MMKSLDKRDQVSQESRLGTAICEACKRSLFFDLGGIAGCVLLVLTALDGVEDLASMDRYFARGFYTQANFVATDFDNNDGNIVVNDDALVLFTGQN